MSTILTSDKLIKSIRRRAFIPRSQETFTNEDFLEMASEEINIGLMSYIIRVHEEYCVYYEDIPIETDKKRYKIPYRAQGNKLRDAALVDENGNFYEMHRLSLDEASDFAGPYNYQFKNCFYLQNNDLILATDEISNYSAVRMFFYLRPSTLVINKRAATIQNITSTTEIDSINPSSGSITNISVDTNTVITSNNHGLSNGDRVLISSSNSTPSIDGAHTVSIVDTNSFSIPINVTVSGNSGSWQKALDVNVLSFTTMPEHFSSSFLFDVCSDTSPNIVLKYDMKSNNIDFVTNTLSIPISNFNEFEVGNYITIAEESIVPNIPTELHPILAQRVAVACLEAMGDEQNKQSAERKLALMEKDGLALLDNRVEGAPIKIKNRHSTLRESVGVRGRRRNRW